MINPTVDSIINLVKDLPETKIGEVITFIQFVKTKQDEPLYLEKDDEDEILNILKNDEIFSSDDIHGMIKEMDE